MEYKDEFVQNHTVTVSFWDRFKVLLFGKITLNTRTPTQNVIGCVGKTTTETHIHGLPSSGVPIYLGTACPREDRPVPVSKEEAEKAMQEVKNRLDKDKGEE